MDIRQNIDNYKIQTYLTRDIKLEIDLESKNIAVLDIETTGLDPINDLIIEIGIVDLDLNFGETKVIFDSFVKEPSFGENHVDSWIFFNSNITFEDIENAPAFKNFKIQLEEIFFQYAVTAYNKSFDLGFLKARGIYIPNELPCIMRTATNICKIPFPNGGSGYKWPKCQEAWDFFFPNNYYIEKHRAADDATHEAKILFELYKLGKYQI